MSQNIPESVLELPIRTWRCTRNLPYSADVEITDRQGYYIEARTKHLARVEFLKLFPTDWQHGFTSQLFS